MKKLLVLFLLCSLNFHAGLAFASTKVFFCELTSIGSKRTAFDPNYIQVFEINSGWFRKDIKRRESGSWKPWCSGNNWNLEIGTDSASCYYKGQLTSILDLVTQSLVMFLELDYDNHWKYSCRRQ